MIRSFQISFLHLPITILSMQFFLKFICSDGGSQHYGIENCEPLIGYKKQLILYQEHSPKSTENNRCSYRLQSTRKVIHVMNFLFRP